MTELLPDQTRMGRVSLDVADPDRTAVAAVFSRDRRPARRLGHRRAPTTRAGR